VDRQAGSVKPEEGGWVPVGPSPIAFDPNTRNPGLGRGADPASDRRLRRRRQARVDRRFQGGGNPRRPRLPAASIPLAHEQPASRPVRQFL
jgi:hypothetical protein